MDTWLIIGLAAGAVFCCVMFWLSVYRPVRKYFQHEHVIADFRREITEWEHKQQCR